MFEDYMQNYWRNDTNNPYQNVYGQNFGEFQYGAMNNPYMNNYQNVNGYQNMNNYPNYGNCNNQNRDWNLNNTYEDIEKYYPDIYTTVYPMVRKVCLSNTRNITRESYEQMVDEIYSNIETNERMELNITLENEVRSDGEVNEKVENRNVRPNNLLRDLIGILVIRELLSRPGCCGQRQRPGMGMGIGPNWGRYFFRTLILIAYFTVTFF